MSIRHITLDDTGQVYEVTNMFDQFGEYTTDPQLAQAFTVKVDADKYLSVSAEDAFIYTVH